MKEIFYRSANLTQEEEILYIYSQNTIKFGNKSLRWVKTHIWTSYSENIKSAKLLDKFKNFM